MKKNTLALIIFLTLVGSVIFYIGAVEDNGSANLSGNNNEELINCLAENGVVIYGTKWCPACERLINSFGGYDLASPIYVECTEEEERCAEEQKTGFVPEIQIDGELYEGGRDLQSLSEKVGCQI